MCNKMELADIKWAFKHMFDLLEEHYTNFENCPIIEDCYTIYEFNCED